MIKFENTEVMGWEAAIRGMRNPMNSWEKSDSLFVDRDWCDTEEEVELANFCRGIAPIIGENDFNLMRRLAAGGPVHAKYRRMITVYVDITAPLYWWKEFDTYKVGTVANSCSTMHKIHAKEFTMEDFSCEHLIGPSDNPYVYICDDEAQEDWSPYEILKEYVLEMLNACREAYLKTKDKRYWWQMIQLLPSSYNQKRTVMMNYEVLAHIYQDRKDHKLDEWAEHNPMIIGVDTDEGSWSLMSFCDWIKTLPYSELITGEIRR